MRDAVGAAVGMHAGACIRTRGERCDEMGGMRAGVHFRDTMGRETGCSILCRSVLLNAQQQQQQGIRTPAESANASASTVGER